jgi:transketolase
MTFSEDRAKRFEAYGWQTICVSDGNDLVSIEAAIEAARAETTRPSLILVRTHIGYGSPEQDSIKAHGSPLGGDGVRQTKERLRWPLEPQFLVPDTALAHFRAAVVQGAKAEAAWNRCVEAYSRDYPELSRELQQRLRGELPNGWGADISAFPPDAKGMATRVAGGKVMNVIAPRLAALCGGSADLDPSTHTELKDQGDFNPTFETGEDGEGSCGGGWSSAGRNIHFGVREHAMGAIVNGLSAHGGFIGYGSTFLIFSDYMRPPIRLAALMGLHVVHVFTHDSLSVGEDGPTHQPIEQLANLRAIPKLTLIRPCDANETVVAWKVAIESRSRPVLLALTRQDLVTLDRSRYASAEGLRRGAYVLCDAKGGAPVLILIASGSEVQLILAAAERLHAEGIAVRCVSMPSWDLFDVQAQSYRDEVLPPKITRRLAVELGVEQGWHRYVGDRGDMLGIEGFGASAPANVLLERYGFTVDNVVTRARRLMMD